MLQQAMQVLNLFTPARQELGVLAAAELLGRPKSTVSRWLSGMETVGFLDRDPVSGLYRVSMRLAAVGEMARQATSLQRTSYAALHKVTASTGETSNLVLLVDGEGTNVEAVSSPRPVMHLGAIGKRFPLHASAAGKALIAWKSESEIRTLLPATLPQFTKTTITGFDQLLRELASVREAGFAVNWKEFEVELVGVGAPVRDHRGDVIAAISISAPAARVTRTDLRKLGDAVATAAMELSETLGYRHTGPDAGPTRDGISNGA